MYDYYCRPHEHAGIVVGRPAGPAPSGESAGPVPEAARRAFPAVEEILRRGTVRRSRGLALAFETFDDATAHLPRFIEKVYNMRRLYSALGYLSPTQFEDQFSRLAVKAIA